MHDSSLCPLCRQRRPKRYCPAVEANICPPCCGEERERSLSCPLTCTYLQQAHAREKPLPVAPSGISYPDVEVTEAQMRDAEELLLFSTYSLMQAALRTPGAVDADVLVAVEALIATQRSRQSGLIYESRPANTIAAAIQRLFSEWLAEYGRTREEREPLRPLRDSDVLRVLVFLHRVGQQNQNGRPKGRLFIHLLQQMTPETERTAEPRSNLIL